MRPLYELLKSRLRFVISWNAQLKLSIKLFYFNFWALLQKLRMPKRNRSQPQSNVHAEVEPRTNHGKRKDRASREAPETLNLVSAEQAEGTNERFLVVLES